MASRRSITDLDLPKVAANGLIDRRVLLRNSALLAGAAGAGLTGIAVKVDVGRRSGMPQLVDGVRAAGECFARRESAGQLLAADAASVSQACYDMARRFHRGGTLIVFGNGGASTDAQHISVEFVHPVIVGKRALPSISLTNDVATLTGVAQRLGYAEVFAHQVQRLGGPHDIALGLSEDGHCENVLRGLQAAREFGMLTVALLGGDGGAIGASPAVDHALVARAEDPLVVKELHVTLYHVLWELAHVFFEQPGVLDPEVLR